MSAFSRFHSSYQRSNMAGLIQVAGSEGPEFAMLVALPGQSPHDAAPVPLFALYSLCYKTAEWLMQNALRPRRLPLVFDLDETLLVAKTRAALEREITAVYDRCAYITIPCNNSMQARF
jgi:hypothetical protein